MCHKKRKLADLKHLKKKLDLCVWHKPEALESAFAGILRSYRYHSPLFIWFCINVCDFMHVKRSNYRLLGQKISRDEEFAVNMLDRLGSNSVFLEGVFFSDESTFLVC